MNILFIDDSPTRRSMFRQACIGASVDLAEDNREALSFLQSGRSYDLICLDFDASEDLFDTFEETIYYISANYQDYTDTRFIVHSLNEVEVPKVVALYKLVGLSIEAIPWLWERISFVDGAIVIKERTYKDN